MDKVIAQYFGEERTIYFNPSDVIGANHYLTYRKHKDYIILSIGSDEGEVSIGIFNIPTALEHCIKHIIYGIW